MKRSSLITFITFSTLSFIAGAFFWFQLRPAQIKHECSWVREVEPAVPAHPAMTKEELEAQGMIQKCSPIKPPNISENTKFVDPVFEKRRQEVLLNSCEQANKRTIEQYSSPREAIPEKEHWREATDEEYKFCLRDKGL